MPKPVQVEPQTKDLRNSPIEEGKPQPGGAAAAGTTCYWNGQAYSPGVEVCSAGRAFVCTHYGSWSNTGRPC
jgi:hypothetical protein